MLKNTKKCNRCTNEYPATKEFFYSDKSKKDGLTTICKTCKSNREVIYSEDDIGKTIDSGDTCKVGIYKITNLINNLVYIGSTVNLYRRKNEHLKELRANKHHNSHMQNSFNKYGEDIFEFTIQDIVFDLESLIEREQFWIDHYKSNDKTIGYNIREKAESNVYLVASEETRRRISNANKGQIVSEETKKKLSIANIGKRYSRSEETRLKLSNAHKGKVFSQDTINKMSIARKEYLKENPITEEEKKARSERMMGENNPNFGKTASNETILKYSKPVLQYDKDNNFIREYISIGSTKEYGFDPSSVTKCCKNKLKYHQGYYWIYKDNQKPSSYLGEGSTTIENTN